MTLLSAGSSAAQAAAAKEPPACAVVVGKNPGAARADAKGATAIAVQSNQAGGAILAQPGLHVALQGTAAPPKVNATAWMVTELESGQIIAACNAHLRLAPASTLKTLTAITLAHRLDWNAIYTANVDDASADGTKVGVVPDSKYRINDLFHGLMMASGNDTAQALANAAGGMITTRDLMMAKAAGLGAADTTVVNDSGLDAAGQVTSAYDLSLFGRAALADPLVSQLITTRTYHFPAAGKSFSAKRKSFMIGNHNWLLANVPGTLGVKNGYTVAAGGSYVVAVRQNGHTYLVAVLRADGAVWHMAADLVKWAFTTHQRAAAVGTLADTPIPAAAASAGPSGTASAGAPGAASPGSSGTASGGAPGGAVDAGRGSLTTTSSGMSALWPWAAAVLGVLIALAAAVLILKSRGRRTAPALPNADPPTGSGPQLLT